MTNRPLVFVDPAGYDLMIAGGYKGNWNLMEWKEWVMAYKGWAEKTFEDVYKGWQTAIGGENGENLKAGNDFLRPYGIQIFLWGGDTSATVLDGAEGGHFDDLIPVLSKCNASDGNGETPLESYTKHVFKDHVWYG